MYCFFLLFGLFCLLVCLNVLEEAGKLPVASWIYSRVGWNIPVFGGAGSVFVTGTILFSHKLPLSWNPLGGEGIIFRGKTKGMSHLVLASKQWPWLPCSLCPVLLVLHTGLDFAWISPLLHTAGPTLLWGRERKRADSSLRKQLGSGGWNELLIYAARVFLLLSLPLQLWQGRFSGFENSIDLSGSDAEVLKYVCLFGFACEIKHHLTSNKQCCYRQCPDSDYAFQKSSLT